MSKEDQILLGGLALAAVIPLVLGGLLGWPAWTTVLLFVVVAVGIYRKLMYGTRTATDHVGALLDKIGLYADSPVRDLTAHRLAKLIEAAGNPKVADEVRRKFDAPHSRHFLPPAQTPTASRLSHNLSNATNRKK